MGRKSERWAYWSLGGFLVAVTAARLWYLHQGYLELSPDEAHYWEWSRRLDWSYYSKGPFVAYLIALSTALGGATDSLCAFRPSSSLLARRCACSASSRLSSGCPTRAGDGYFLAD